MKTKILLTNLIYLVILSINLFTIDSLKSFKSKNEVSVIILGAGVSGISTAYFLHKAGIKSTILEAQDRPFGRVKTESETFGYPVDHGAIWVDFTLPGNPFQKYMKKFKTQLVKVNPKNSTLFGLDNKQYNYYKEFKEIFGRFIKFSNYRKPLEYLNIYAQQTNFTESEYLFIKEYFNLFFFDKIKHPIEKSYFKVITESYMSFFFQSKGFYMLPKGYGEFFSNFLTPLKIKYKTVITKVTHDKDKVEFIDSNGEKYVGDYAVITAPLGVLKKNLIKFDPDLSKGKKNAIRKTSIQQINKVMVEFEEKFWGNEFLIFLLDKQSSIFMGVNFHKVNGKNILIFIVNDTHEYVLSSKSEEDIKQFLQRKMEACYPGKSVIIKKLLKTNWSESPFTYGAYSRERNTSHKDIFNKPEGRVYFAGEHTAERPASTQGAWISGRDRANQIIKKLSKK